MPSDRCKSEDSVGSAGHSVGSVGDSVKSAGDSVGSPGDSVRLAKEGYARLTRLTHYNDPRVPSVAWQGAVSVPLKVSSRTRRPSTSWLLEEVSRP